MGFAIFEKIADAFAKGRFMGDSGYFSYLASGVHVDGKIVAEFERRCARMNWARMSRNGDADMMSSALGGVMGIYGPGGADAPLMMDALVSGVKKSMERFGPEGAVVFLQTPGAGFVVDGKFLGGDEPSDHTRMADVFLSVMAAMEASSMSKGSRGAETVAPSKGRGVPFSL